jgi:O-antigen/teichoic acid export membrane protein
VVNWKTTGASLGAVLASLLTLGCCLPLAFVGAAGLASASVFLAGARPWLLGLSVALLGVGFFQVYRGICRRARQSKTAIICLGLSTLIVFLLLLFPQAIASMLADISSNGHR